eukprot:3355847-Amphidinium_carterae.1
MRSETHIAGILPKTAMFEKLHNKKEFCNANCADSRPSDLMNKEVSLFLLIKLSGKSWGGLS